MLCTAAATTTTKKDVDSSEVSESPISIHQPSRKVTRVTGKMEQTFWSFDSSVKIYAHDEMIND